jgi:hypothetical protein
MDADTKIGLSAKVICRTSLCLLSEARGQYGEFPERAESYETSVRGLYGLRLWLAEGELATDLELFSRRRLLPAIKAWAALFHGVELGWQYLIKPMGFADAANERFNGVAMRCIINAADPIGDRPILGQMTRWYDVVNDEFRVVPCAPSLSLWVHAIDSDARYEAA